MSSWTNHVEQTNKLVLREYKEHPNGKSNTRNSTFLSFSISYHFFFKKYIPVIEFSVFTKTEQLLRHTTNLVFSISMYYNSICQHSCRQTPFYISFLHHRFLVHNHNTLSFSSFKRQLSLKKSSNTSSFMTIALFKIKYYIFMYHLTRKLLVPYIKILHFHEVLLKDNIYYRKILKCYMATFLFPNNTISFSML